MSPSITCEEAHVRYARPVSIKPCVCVVPVHPALKILNPTPEQGDGFLCLLLVYNVLDDNHSMLLEIPQPLFIGELEPLNLKRLLSLLHTSIEIVLTLIKEYTL